MRCSHKTVMGRCRNDATLEGLCDKHARECSKGGCANVTDRRYCDEHKCAKGGCDLPRFARGDSCEDHGCVMPVVLEGVTAGCGDARKGDSTFCPKHACSSAKCKKPRGTGGECCEDHGCQRRLDKTYCGAKRKQDSSYFCKNHACAVPDCPTERPPDGEYCSKHECSNAGCRNVPVDESKFCAEHCCHDDGCTKGGGTSGQYCTDHGCVSHLQGGHCGQLKKYPSSYCAFHVCAKCAKPRGGDGECCEEHGCKYESGGTPCCAVPKDRSEYCVDHSCADKDCGERREGVDCCNNHRCKYSGGSERCRLSKKPSSHYCVDHACRNPRCSEVREGGEYCKRHARAQASGKPTSGAAMMDGFGHSSMRADAEGTGNVDEGRDARRSVEHCESHVSGPKSAICGAPKAEKSRWCVLHACKQAGCDKSNDGLGSCCQDHGCAYRIFARRQNRTCLEPRKGDGAYCDSHMCARCGKFTYSADNRHCESHTCTHVDGTKRCPNPREGERNVCSTHAGTERAPFDLPPKPSSVTLPREPSRSTLPREQPRGTQSFGTQEDPVAEMKRLLQANELADINIIDNPSLSWDDVIGADEAKKAIQQSIIQPYRRPDLYPGGWSNGILLFGPPGTGKTMLIAAMANRISGILLNVGTANIIRKWFGESEQRIEDLFRTAREFTERRKKPVILFMDEVDALLGETDYRHGWEVRTQNGFLTCMSGVMTTGKKSLVYVIGATNQPQNIALGFRRRFQKQILVDLPGTDARKEIFKLYCGKFETTDDVDFDSLAAKSDGYSGADIEQVCKDANDIAVDEVFATGSDEAHADKRAITMGDLSKSLGKRKPVVNAKQAQWYRDFS